MLVNMCINYFQEKGTNNFRAYFDTTYLKEKSERNI